MQNVKGTILPKGVPMEHYITIGEIIRHYRKEKGLSQAALADGICERKYISNLENNKNIPTLDIINQLSERLQINLYETYALMLRHHDIDTHNKIEKLSQHFTFEKAKFLLPLIEEYEKLPAFQYGEPLQIIKYAKALYLSNEKRNFSEAIAMSLEGLSIDKNFHMNNSPMPLSLSNVELCLLNAIGVDYCRNNQPQEGKKYFQYLLDYVYQLYAINHYASNRNNQFEIKMLSNVVYNYFTFFRDDPLFDSENIDKALLVLKTLHCHHKLPELLLCKTYLKCKAEQLEEAKQLYTLAHSLALYLYEAQHVENIEKSILITYYHQLTEH